MYKLDLSEIQCPEFNFYYYLFRASYILFEIYGYASYRDCNNFKKSLSDVAKQLSLLLKLK